MMITINITWLFSILVSIYLIFKFWKKILKIIISISIIMFIFLVGKVKQKIDVIYKGFENVELNKK